MNDESLTSLLKRIREFCASRPNLIIVTPNGDNLSSLQDTRLRVTDKTITIQRLTALQDSILTSLNRRKIYKMEIKKGRGEYTPLTDQEQRYRNFRNYQMSGSMDLHTTFEEFVELDNLIQGAMDTGE
ncbi:hypothetical protein CENTIMANUS_00305 [Klebsiella phage vB_KpM_Centimanus]